MEVLHVKTEDFTAFVSMMTIVSDTYGQPRMSEAAAKLYFGVLSDYSLDDVSKAIAEHLKQSPYMPKPCDIIKNIKGTAEERALMAWRHVLRAITKYGRYQSIKFDDPVIHYAIDYMGGWHRICQIFEEELPFREKDFVKHYIHGERIANWSNVPEYFVGEHEIRNTRSDHSEAAPKFVLVQTKATQKALDSGTKE